MFARALAVVLSFALAGCTLVPIHDAPPCLPVDPPWHPAPPPVEPPPVVPVPPTPPPPVEPTPPPPIGELPAVGTTKAAVVAAWGPGSDLPENPGEDDAVAYVRVVSGRQAEVHVIYRGGLVAKVVVTYLGGGG